MIVGYGDLASALTDREEALFFASGVSNSNCTEKKEFSREYIAMASLRGDSRCIFYFSSLFCETKDTPYFKHKLEMEGLVKECFKNYNIIRLGNITWGTNPHTFINYLRDRIAKGMPVKIKNEYRFVIDKKHFQVITQSLPLEGQNCFSVFTRMAKIKDLIK